jgi:hypothetical protein
LYAPNEGTFHMMIGSPPVIDRSVQIATLHTALETATATAEQCGVPITTIVRHLLERAEWRCNVASDRGVDLSALQGWNKIIGSEA